MYRLINKYKVNYINYIEVIIINYNNKYNNNN